MHRARNLVVNGRVVARNGQLTHADERELAAHLNDAVRRLCG